MDLRHRLFTLFNVEPGEGLLVIMLLAHSFFIGSACIFARSSVYALFLAEFDASFLPYVYVCIGVVVTLLSFIYLKLSERISFIWLLTGSVAFLLVSLVGIRLGLSLTSAAWLIFLLPVWYEVLWALTNLEFWNLAGRLFNLRQGKRLFGLIGAGEQVATILGGLLVPLVVGFTGTPELLLVSGVSLVGVLGLLLVTNARFRSLLVEPAGSGRQAERRSEGKSTLSLLKNHYILAIFGLFALDIAVYFTVDNIFYSQAQAQYPSEEVLAGFIGAFFGAAGILSVLSRALVTGKLLNRFGVRLGLLLMPGLLMAGSLAAVLAGILPAPAAAFFWMVALTRLIDMVVLVSVEMPTVNVLYQPLPAAQRVQTQAMVEGIVYSLSIGFTGVVLTLLTSVAGLKDLQLMLVVVLLLTGWIALALRLGRLYPRALVSALAQRRLDSADLAWDDAATIAVLQRELHSPHAPTVLYAMNMLENTRPEALAEALPALLEHPEALVRQDALGRVERLRLASAAPAIRRRLEGETSPEVRGAAVCTLAALEGLAAFESPAAVLDDPLPQVRSGALVGLLRHGGSPGAGQAAARLEQMAASAGAEQRLLAARVLGEAAAADQYQLLLPLLDDPAPAVRRTALQAAGQMRSPHLWPAVVQALGSPEVRPAAAAALARGGAPVLPELSLAYEQGEIDRGLLARVCGRIGGKAAIEWLVRRLEDGDAGVRSAVLLALSRCGYRAGDGGNGAGGDASSSRAAQARRLAREEVRQSALLQAQIADLEGAGETALLRGALRGALDQGRERIFLLLSFIFDPAALLKARDNLALASAERRAYALEVLDVSLDGEAKKLLFPLLSEQPAAQVVQQLQADFPQARSGAGARLQEIISGSTAQGLSPWARACAVYSAGCLALPTLAPQVREALDAPQPLLRETAAWVLPRLDGAHSPAAPQPTPTGRPAMLTTIEKVIALKKISLFETTPDETLVDIAALLEEVTLPGGETIFEKGDLGDCLYLIVDGEVRVQDGPNLLNMLGAGDVFGEMSVLDAEPRSATVITVEETRLLRLDQEPLFALTDEQPEVARRILRVLSRRLRLRVQDLNDLRRQLAAAGAPPTR